MVTLSFVHVWLGFVVELLGTTNIIVNDSLPWNKRGIFQVVEDFIEKLGGENANPRSSAYELKSVRAPPHDFSTRSSCRSCPFGQNNYQGQLLFFLIYVQTKAPEVNVGWCFADF